MKLIDIPAIFICPDHNTKFKERKIHVENLLTEIGFKTIIHFKSGFEEYPICLTKAIIAILEKYNNDDPIIIIEDDVEPFLHLDENIEIEFPDNTDAFYLGFSKCGGSKTNNVDDGPSIIQSHNDKYIRIINMLSTHAIIYKSKVYKEAVINTLSNMIGKDRYHSDVLISRLQPSYNIYGYYHPLFYQSAKFGNVQHVENVTKFSY